MSTKTVAAIVVAALVAGVVLGTLGVAGAGTSKEAAAPGAIAPAPAIVSGACGDCTNEAAASGDCGDCADAAPAATAANSECGDCSSSGGAAQAACPGGSGECATGACP